MEPTETKPQETKPQRKSKAVLIVIILCFLIIVAVLVVGIVLILRQLSAEPAPVGVEGSRNLVVDENNLAEIEEQMSQQVAEGYFETDMNLIWTFEDSSTPSGDAYVANSPNNLFTMYFDVALEDGGEVVYSSSLIPLGMTIKEIKLQKDLPAGEYPAICTYHMVDDDGNDKGYLNVALTMVVLN